MITRRLLVTRVLAGTAAAALPTGHVAHVLTATAEPEPIPISPGVDVIERSAGSAVLAEADVYLIARLRDGIGNQMNSAEGHIAARSDGSGTLVLRGTIDRGTHMEWRRAEVTLDAEAFAPLFDLCFAQRFRVAEAVAVTRHPHDAPIETGRAVDAALVNDEPHVVVYGSSDKAREVGFDRVVKGGTYPYSRWYAVKTEPTEPHLPVWLTA